MYKTNIILTFVLLQKNTSRNPCVFVARLRRELAECQNVSFVCSCFNEKNRVFIYVYLSYANCTPYLAHAHFFALRKKSACSPSAVNDFNKSYSTSAVPLLVRNVSYVCGAVARNTRNINKIKLKKH